MRPSWIDLEQYWWHRLFKVALWLSAVVVIGAVFVGAAVESQTKTRKLTRTVGLNDMMLLVQLESRRDVAAAAVSASELMDRFLGLGNGGLGCELEPNRVDTAPVLAKPELESGGFCVLAESASDLGARLRAKGLLQFTGFSDTQLAARFGTGLVCVIPNDICNGDPKQLVRTNETFEPLPNETRTRILGAGLVSSVVSGLIWFWLVRLVYLRVIIYVAFGRA